MTELEKINACAKRPIDIWTNFIYYPLSIRLVYVFRNTSVSPNGLTLTSLVFALIGCGMFADGRPDWLWGGLLLVQLSYVVDCADGQLARYKQRFSPIGGWLDQVADRVKEFAVYFALAFGYWRRHPDQPDIWLWATVALFALYMLEYLGQIDILGKQQSKADSIAVPAVQQAPPDTFQRLQTWRSYIPFRSFIIGEQYFAMLVFLVFAAVHTFFAFVSILGSAMFIYRCAITLYKYNRLQSRLPE